MLGPDPDPYPIELKNADPTFCRFKSGSTGYSTGYSLLPDDCLGWERCVHLPHRVHQVSWRPTEDHVLGRGVIQVGVLQVGILQIAGKIPSGRSRERMDPNHMTGLVPFLPFQ